MMADYEDRARNECQNLLVSLKTTVEVLLGNQSANVWNTYGGLSRLTRVVANILCHRSKCSQEAEDCWNFILGLRVLVPTIAPWLERHRLATEGNANRSYLWLQQRLQEHTLSSYLKVLLDDQGHLKASYHDGAFVRQSNYAEALLTCLRAIEDNQLKLLAEIDPNLLVHRASSSSSSPLSPLGRKHGVSSSNVLQETGENSKQFSKYNALHRTRHVDPETGIHHRARYLYKLKLCSDFSAANSILPKSTTWHFNLSQLSQSLSPTAELTLQQGRKEINSGQRSMSISHLNRSPLASHSSESDPISSCGQSKSEPCLANVDITTHVAVTTKSLTCIRLAVDAQNGVASKCDVNQQISSSAKPETPKVTRSPSHTRSRSDIGVHSINLNRPEDETGVPTICNIPMSASLPNVLEPNATLRPNIEEEFVPTPIFRRPVEGQSLTSFLSSQDFRTCAELDKENAHFSISEALIAAIEQIKCNQMLKIAEEEDQESDDDEIKHLKQRIRIRRRQKLQEKFEYRTHLHSDGCTDTTTTSQTPSPRSTSSEKSSNSDSVDQLDLSDGSEIDTKLSTLHETGLSLSMASLYSDADIQRPGVAHQQVHTQESHTNRNLENTSQCLSAESVALNLLKKFSEKQLPKASDLEWLVSEQDAPQQLLPLPSSWPVSPDDADDGHYQQSQMRLRGNFQWAPPRPQIIFNVHPSPKRKVIMAKQNYRCAGCGTKVEQGFMKRFRYCEYLGKYFCQCCHNNSFMYIPGRILKKWDFNKYYVSNFSLDLLQRIAADPLYDVSQLNPTLYRRVKSLQQVFQLRLQLYYTKDFVQICRNCVGLADELQQLPSHLLQTPHLYSLVDLVQVRNGEMLNRLKPIAAQTIAHIAQCQLCQARGFFCEFCKNHEDLIFPFQIGTVIRCPGCWACYHVSCFVPGKCPKCARIEARRLRQMQGADNDS